ncbi:expressed unknown protein [Seminavis robusta]|uniref:Uncharacterized protein n=1 Tax=Seminavis robusta TaxID=568900 RepID=A0A9N8ENR0_9STRA|nr:expressed unknown protein [Seminavis robusta]|eukprot:Sro1298_g260630.1 n/a (872) ;mRNA; r:22489-25104
MEDPIVSERNSCEPEILATTSAEKPSSLKAREPEAKATVKSEEKMAPPQSEEAPATSEGEAVTKSHSIAMAHSEDNTALRLDTVIKVSSDVSDTGLGAEEKKEDDDAAEATPSPAQNVPIAEIETRTPPPSGEAKVETTPESKESAKPEEDYPVEPPTHADEKSDAVAPVAVTEPKDAAQTAEGKPDDKVDMEGDVKTRNDASKDVPEELKTVPEGGPAQDTEPIGKAKEQEKTKDTPPQEKNAKPSRDLEDVFPTDEQSDVKESVVGKEDDQKDERNRDDKEEEKKEDDVDAKEQPGADKHVASKPSESYDSDKPMGEPAVTTNQTKSDDDSEKPMMEPAITTKSTSVSETEQAEKCTKSVQFADDSIVDKIGQSRRTPSGNNTDAFFSCGPLCGNFTDVTDDAKQGNILGLKKETSPSQPTAAKPALNTAMEQRRPQKNVPRSPVVVETVVSEQKETAPEAEDLAVESELDAPSEEQASESVVSEQNKEAPSEVVFREQPKETKEISSVENCPSAGVEETKENSAAPAEQPTMAAVNEVKPQDKPNVEPVQVKITETNAAISPKAKAAVSPKAKTVTTIPKDNVDYADAIVENEREMTVQQSATFEVQQGMSCAAVMTCGVLSTKPPRHIPLSLSHDPIFDLREAAEKELEARATFYEESLVLAAISATSEANEPTEAKAHNEVATELPTEDGDGAPAKEADTSIETSPADSKAEPQPVEGSKSAETKADAGPLVEEQEEKTPQGVATPPNKSAQPTIEQHSSEPEQPASVSPKAVPPKAVSPKAVSPKAVVAQVPASPKQAPVPVKPKHQHSPRKSSETTHDSAIAPQEPAHEPMPTPMKGVIVGEEEDMTAASRAQQEAYACGCTIL